MSRLTDKNCANYDDFVFSFRNSLITRSELDNGIYKKLKYLEDIEEELGIDLRLAIDICKKVNKQKYVYVKESYGINKLTFSDDLDIELFNHRLYSNSRNIWVSLDLKEFGKTWSLVKSDLVNDIVKKE